MESAAKKIRQEYQDEEDRISSLPNELVHKILSFTDAKEAVRTSVLSKRWKPIWLTLPFLNFGIYTNCSFHKTYMFLRHVLLNRDHHSNVYQLNLSVSDKFCVKVPNERSLLKRFIEYAISHSVENLGIRLAYNNYKPFKLSTFSSKSLRKLTLQLVLDDESVESDCWDLPVLTTLHLKADPNDCPDLPYSCLTCLPALTTLCLEDWDFTSYFSFTFSKLTTLCLSGPDRLPETVWNFPCLLSLELAVDLPRNINHVLSTFVNLQNLTIVLREMFWKPDLFISCPQLLNLNLTICSSVPPTYSIAVLAPKLCSFTSSGIFSITFGVIQLQNVNIKLQDWFQDMKREDREKYYLRFTNMLLGFGSAKNISFDSDSIEVKYVKLPEEYKKSSISSAVRSYLLGGSPKATIVASLLQNNMIPQTEVVSATAENAVLQDPLAAPTKELVDCQHRNKALSVHTVDMGVQEQHMLENPLVDADRVKKVDSPVEGTSNDRVSSTKGYRGFGLWRGHEVNSECVCLLDLIMHKYPETFEHFTTKNKRLCTLMLNTLCSSLNAFTKMSMTEVDSESIVKYRNTFAYLQNMGFNLSWVVTRLNYVQHLRFSKPLLTELHAIDCRIDDTKSKIQDLQAQVNDAKNILQILQTHRSEKMTEIQKEFGTMGTNLAVGCIGDDLLSSP